VGFTPPYGDLKQGHQSHWHLNVRKRRDARRLDVQTYGAGRNSIGLVASVDRSLASFVCGRMTGVAVSTSSGGSVDPLMHDFRSNNRVRVGGKFLRLGNGKFYVKGFCYGPFSLNSRNEYLPEPPQMAADFRHMRQLGANTVRLYSVPSSETFDELLRHGLRAIIDVPWEKHRCFFEDWTAKESARRQIRTTAEFAAKHPAVLAISVVNEIPNDVVRYHGHKPIQAFIEELGDSVKQIAPECLTTFANYPTTEFLQPSGFDFCCFNVYLHDLDRLGAYFDRLQHIAGDIPLVLGEFGVDSFRQGKSRQADLLAGHVQTVFRHGLAGSIVFSYTDDWFTGGTKIADWGFGVTTEDRSEKPAAAALQEGWRRAPFAQESDLPKVSVVVCAYNAASTLPECLTSLMRVDYPEYEVILVDDGSKDSTPKIAADFPQVRYVRQENHGLSDARNVGVQLSTGEIVAYTDADCAADEDWLRCLVQAMRDQGVPAVGGPNITPLSDGWSAHCVAASPGNPSHVMFDDRHAEHVPGCNMAFRRESILNLGGFDPQYRAAGDDVDFCWRLLDHGGAIGYAPGAFVWHHRRQTVGAYLRQQIGYGRAEALLHFMHPHRFSLLGHCGWHGRIYGSGAIGLPLVPERIYYGTFGFAPFQTIYRHNQYGPWACVTWFEWHLVALFFLALGFIFWPLALISLLMWSGSLVLAVDAARKAKLPNDAPWWCRPLVGTLYLVQPPIRAWYRATYDLRLWRPKLSQSYCDIEHEPKIISSRACDLYWLSDRGLGRESLLRHIVDGAKRLRWLGVFNNGWATWDIKLVGDLWHTLLVQTASEELGSNRRFTRARVTAEPTTLNRVVAIASLIWSAAALISLEPLALLLAMLASTAVLVHNIRSSRSCLRAATSLVARAGCEAALSPLDSAGKPSEELGSSTPTLIPPVSEIVVRHAVSPMP
jgi:GT2 family glycosyltransferase